MANYFEYTTVQAFKDSKAPNSTATTDDAFILKLIREASHDVEFIFGHVFAPLIATRYFDADKCVKGNGLRLNLDPFDLLAVTSITNGDTASVTSTQYVFEPRHNPPYWGILLKSSKGISWTYTDDPENAITVVGVWGYHDDYASAWEQVTTLGAALNISATSTTLAAASGNPGELWKIDSEYLYLSARTTTTATIVRGANGSTAAAHDNASVIYRWLPMAQIESITKAAAIMKYALREDPKTEMIIMDGQTLAVQKDVRQWIREQARAIGLVRV